MEYALVSVLDSKVGAFEPAICVPAAGAAVRWFGDQVLNKESPYGKHPEDYSLWKVGTFRVADGLVAGVFPPEKLIDAGTVVSVSLNGKS